MWIIPEIYHADRHTGFGWSIGRARYISIWPLRWWFGVQDGEFYRRYYIGCVEITVSAPIAEMMSDE